MYTQNDLQCLPIKDLILIFKIITKYTQYEIESELTRRLEEKYEKKN